MCPVIREMKERDLPEIRKLTAQTGWKFDVSKTEKKELNKEDWKRGLLEQFEKMIRRRNHKIFVVENEDHDFVGYIWVGEGTNMVTGKKHGFIYDIFVNRKFREKGIGRLLLKKAEDYCQERGYSRILLMVSAKNIPATNLYEKVGYRKEQIYMGKDLAFSERKSLSHRSITQHY